MPKFTNIIVLYPDNISFFFVLVLSIFPLLKCMKCLYTCIMGKCHVEYIALLVIGVEYCITGCRVVKILRCIVSILWCAEHTKVLRSTLKCEVLHFYSVTVITEFSIHITYLPTIPV